jgi:ketosteroid isomerase-like protein
VSLRLLHEHVERFNAAVRSGDFGPMLEHFTDDAELVFEGVPVGPFQGKDAIAAAYREQPPDDEIDVLEAREEGESVVASYGWRADRSRRAGDMILTTRGDLIARLVVTFDSSV